MLTALQFNTLCLDIPVLRLYYEIETRAKFVKLAYGYTMSSANNANSVNMRSNGPCRSQPDLWQLSPTNYNVVNINYNN